MCAAHWLVYARARPPRVSRATTASPKIRRVHMIAPPLHRRRRSPPAAPVSPPPRATVIIHYYIYISTTNTTATVATATASTACQSSSDRTVTPCHYDKHYDRHDAPRTHRNGEEEGSTASKRTILCSCSLSFSLSFSLFWSLLRFGQFFSVCGSSSFYRLRTCTRGRRSRKTRSLTYTPIPHARFSQAPTHVSHLRTNRLRTTESPAACVTRFKSRTSTTPRCQPLTPLRYRPRRRRRDVVAATAAAAFSQRAGAAAGGEKGNRQVMWPSTSGENERMILAMSASRARPRTRMSVVARDHCGDREWPSRFADIHAARTSNATLFHAYCTLRFTHEGASVRPEIGHRFLSRKMYSIVHFIRTKLTFSLALSAFRLLRLSNSST